MGPTYAQRKAIIRDSYPRRTDARASRAFGEPLEEWGTVGEAPVANTAAGKANFTSATSAGRSCAPRAAGVTPRAVFRPLASETGAPTPGCSLNSRAWRTECSRR